MNLLKLSFKHDPKNAAKIMSNVFNDDKKISSLIKNFQKLIGLNEKKTFLVAEISANHCGSLNLAKRLIKSAKKNGADAVKLQTYTPET